MAFGLHRCTSVLLALCLFISQGVLGQSHTMVFLEQNTAPQHQMNLSSGNAHSAECPSMANSTPRHNVQTGNSAQSSCCDSDCMHNDACQSHCGQCFAFSASGAIIFVMSWSATISATTMNPSQLKHFYVLSGRTDIRPPIA